MVVFSTSLRAYADFVTVADSSEAIPLQHRGGGVCVCIPRP
jgi:hypothetical protein